MVHVYCGQTAEWMKMKLGMEVGLGPGHIVLDGEPAHHPPKGHSPQFSSHISCGQMAGWIKMPLGREVVLGLSDIVLDVDPKKGGTAHPNFGPYQLLPNGWMHQDETWHGGRPRPRTHFVRWGPSSPSTKGHGLQFWAHICCGQTAGCIKMTLGMEVGQGTLF